MTHNWCYTWDHDLDQYDLGSFIDANKKSPTDDWSIYESKGEFSSETLALREQVEHYFAPIEYMGVWDYHEGYVDDLGPHIDDVPESLVLFFCPRGELTVTLHNESKEVIDTKVLNSQTGMALYHTRFMHDIQGVGDLVVFGISKDFDADSYFSTE